MTTDDIIEEYLARLTDIIDEHGWGVQSVPDNEPSLHYTVGLCEKNLPELVIFGLPIATAHALLNDLAHIAVDEGPIEHGATFHHLANLPLRVIDAYDVSDLKVAHRWADREVVAQQVLYPDPQGRFITDPEYDMGLYIPLLTPIEELP